MAVYFIELFGTVCDNYKCINLVLSEGVMQSKYLYNCNKLSISLCSSLLLCRPTTKANTQLVVIIYQLQ